MRALYKMLVLAVALTLTSGVAFAKAGGKHGGPGKMGRGMASELNLTEAQKAQLKPIFEQFMSQQRARKEAMEAKFKSVLTPEQMARFEQLKSERQAQRQADKAERKADRQSWKDRKNADGPGMGKGGIIGQLNLTPEQTAQLRAHREAQQAQVRAEREQFMAQVKSVLTPEQQAKMQQIQSQRQERFQERRNGKGRKQGGTEDDNFSVPGGF
jgi:protein CpxP